MTDHTPGDNDTPPPSSVSGFSDRTLPPLTPPVQPVTAHQEPTPVPQDGHLQPYDGHAQPYGAYPPAYGYGPPTPQPTNGLAVAALVVSCVAVVALCGPGVGALLGIVGAVLGHVARRRIRRTGEGGAGLALAGIVIGWVCTAVGAALIVGLAALLTNGSFGP